MTEQEYKSILAESQDKLIAFNKAQEKLSKEGSTFLNKKLIDDVYKAGAEYMDSVKKCGEAAVEYLNQQK